MLSKRFMSIFLVLSVFFGLFAFADEPSEKYNPSIMEGKYELLEILEIIDEARNGEFTEDTVVTRGEFAEYLAKIAGVSKISASTYEGSFTDVSNKSSCFSSVQALESMRVINGNGNGLFLPDEPVLVRDAVVMAVRLLGYDVYAEANGGYPTGYFAIANKIGLTKKVIQEGVLKGESALSFFLNILTTNVIVQTSWGNPDKMEIAEGKSYLESVFDMYEDDGIVSANELTGLTDPKKFVGENCVEINGVVYLAEGLDTNDMLGKKINYVYEYNKSNTYDATIVWFEEHRDVEVVTIDSKDISLVDNYEIVMEWDGTKEKKYKFSGSSDVIYNFKAYPGYRFNNIDIEMGYLNLIDNDGNGTYDVIKVTEYEEYVVAAVSYEDKSITLEDGSVIEFPFESSHLKIYRFGAVATFEDVYDRTVINVISSVDGDYAIIYADGGVISGTVTGFEEDEAGTYISIDGAQYTMSSKADFKPDIGDYGSFYINVFGEVAARNRSIITEKYAYLIKVHMQGSVYDGKYLLKLLTSNGIEALEVADKISLNKATPVDSEKVLKSAELLKNGVLDDNGAPTCQQLIRFKTDLKGRVNYIRTFENVMDETFRADDSRKDRYDDRFTLDFKVDSTYEHPDGETPNEMITNGILYYGGSALVFGSKFLMTSNTPVIIAPPTYSDDNEAFEYRNRGCLSSERTYKNIELYDIPRSYKVGAAVLRVANSSVESSASVYTAERCLVISRITKVFIESEATKGLKITGYKSGKKVEYLVKNLDLKDYSAAYGNGKGVTDLKAGDVIQAAIDSKGFINGIRILNSYNKDTFGYWNPSGNMNYANAILCPMAGRVIFRDNESITVNCKKPVEGISDKRWDRAYHILPSSHFYEMDTQRGILKKVSVSDIPEDGMVFMHTANHMLWDVVYYK